MNFFAKKKIFHAKAGARGGKRADLQGLYVRSRWEANFVRVLNIWKERGIITKWEYEPLEFFFPVKRGTRYYKPDFRIWYTGQEQPTYIEVKGLFQQKDITALTRMAKYFPEETVLIIGKKEYQEFESEFGELEHWER